VDGVAWAESTLGGQASYTEQAPAVTLNPWIVLSDVDNATLSSATVSISPGLTSGDVLSFSNDGSTMGNITSSYDSASGVLLLSSSGATATIAQWTTALKAVAFASSSDAPGTSRTISWVVNDGLLPSLTATSSIVVTPINDVPTLTSATTLTGFAEDTYQEITYADLTTACNEADVDGDAISFRIESVSTGSLQKWNGATWNAVLAGTTLLSSGEKLQWKAASNANGSGLNAFTVKTWDGALASATAVQVKADVAAVNDAPVASGSSTLSAVYEDTVAGSLTGDTVSNLFTARFNDSIDTVVAGSSANTLAGIAIAANAATAGQGVWEFYNGTSWAAVGSPTDAVPLLVASNHSLRFVAAGDFNGAPGSLTVRLIDNSTSVTTGNTGADLSNAANYGGITAISAATVSLGTSVTAVNDVPSFTKGADQTVLEDAGAQTVNAWASSLSKGPADESSQTLNFIVSNNNNALFSSQPTIDASGNLTYTAAANANGSATVTVQIHDDGGTSTGVDTSACWSR
jgi:hypothetical protein